MSAGQAASSTEPLASALGCFVRPTAEPIRAAKLYGKDGLGLPLLRQETNALVFWLGETLVLRLAGAERAADAAAASCIPYLRCHDIDEVLDRALAAGAKLLDDAPVPNGREAHIADAGGHILGLRERDRLSTAANDIEAWRRFDVGSMFDPGVGPMPAEIQSLGWVLLRVHDLAGVTAFYRDTCLLTLCNEGEGHAEFDLGDNVVLQLRRHAPATTPLAAGDDSIVLRTADIGRVAKHLAARGIGWAGVPEPGETLLIRDPEGHGVGFLQASPQPTPEDAEADRRRLARQAQGK